MMNLDSYLPQFLVTIGRHLRQRYLFSYPANVHQIYFGDTIQKKYNTKAGEFSLIVPMNKPRKYMNENDEYEPGLISALLDELTMNSVFYDVGAEFGYISTAVHTAGLAKNDIHAFEPHPYNCSILRQNISSFASVYGTIVADSSKWGKTTLTDYANNNTTPDVIKIDTEGSEMEVLIGSKDLLRNNHPELFIEVHPQFIKNTGYSVDDLVNFLQNTGYKLKIVDHRLKNSVETSTWRKISTSSPPSDREFLLWATTK